MPNVDVWACGAAAGGGPCPQGPFLWEPAVVEAGTRPAAAHMAQTTGPSPPGGRDGPAIGLGPSQEFTRAIPSLGSERSKATPRLHAPVSQLVSK